MVKQTNLFHLTCSNCIWFKAFLHHLPQKGLKFLQIAIIQKIITILVFDGLFQQINKVWM